MKNGTTSPGTILVAMSLRDAKGGKTRCGNLSCGVKEIATGAARALAMTCMGTTLIAMSLRSGQNPLQQSLLRRGVRDRHGRFAPSR